MEKEIPSRFLPRKDFVFWKAGCSGKTQNVAKVKLMDPSGTVMDGVYFGEAEEFVRFIDGKDSISVTYYPEINIFRGRESIQIVIQNYC